MPLLMYKTYYLDYLYSNHNFMAVFLRSQKLHSTDTLPIMVQLHTVVYGYGTQPYKSVMIAPDADHVKISI